MEKKEGFLYNLVESFPEQIENSYLMDVPKLSHPFHRIVIIGMGGSYIGGLVLKQFLRDEIKIPIEVYCGEYPYIDEDTLVVLISYSGNTKEVVNAFMKLRKHNILAITSGGKLEKLAKARKKMLIKVPKNLHQRFTFSYGFFPLLKFLEESLLIRHKKKIIGRIILTLKTKKNEIEDSAIKLATNINKKNLLFYSSNYFYPTAYRFQTAIAEDAKIICHSNKITELFHNELETFPNTYFPILLLDKNEMLSYKRQLKYFRNIINEYYEFPYESYSREERMFLMFYFADFLGLYLSKMKGIPMGETPLSDKIKKL